MWGIVAAAGAGSRLQPLGFSKELLPLGSRLVAGTERPRAVSEYLIDRMILAGVTQLCFVISPEKSDILAYYGDRVGPAEICYVVQPRPVGFCDALFRARFLVRPDETALVGLPDTVWFPEDGFLALEAEPLSFLLFPVEEPERFDAVVADAEGRVQEIQVKQVGARSSWIWGGFKLTGAILRDLYDLWREPGRQDEYLGTLVNAYLARGGRALGVRAGQAYMDVGTLAGYREAIARLGGRAGAGPERFPATTARDPGGRGGGA